MRYRASARKRSPILDADELRRFAIATLDALGEVVSPGVLLRSLQLRMDLDPPALEPLDHEQSSGSMSAPNDVVALRETAIAAIAELTRRQVDVLLGTDAGNTLDQMAARLNCSRVTVLNERRRAGEVLTRLSSSEADRDALLNTVLEALYEATG